MKYTCPFTSLPFSTNDGIENKTILISVHPALTAHTDQILSLPPSFLKIAGILYYLAKKNILTYTPFKSFSLSHSEETQNEDIIPSLCVSLHSLVMRLNDKKKPIPRFCLNKSTLVEIRNWVELCLSILAEDDPASLFLQSATPGQRKRFSNAVSSEKNVLKRMVEWADGILIRTMPGYNIHVYQALLATFDGKKNLGELKKLRDAMMDFLPDTDIRKDIIIRGIDKETASIIASFGGATSMLSAAEKEFAQTTLSRYTQSDDIPVEIQALSAMLQQEQEKPMPVRESFASQLEYTIALLAWKAQHPSM